MKSFKISTYNISSTRLTGKQKVTFAILADLHGLVFGKNHQTLYKAILASQPDANSPALSLTAMEEMIGTPSQPGFHVLLAHNPKYGNTYFSWGADLILSGHYHGGVLRLDQNHGLTCPQYLLFPPFCCGEFKKGKQHMIVSAGLGEHTIPVRIHNPRELVLINLYPQSTKSVKEH